MQRRRPAARICSDKFTVLITEVSDKEAVAAIAKKIVASISEPLVLGDYVEELVRLADQAMYKVKLHGKNNYVFVNETDASI